jgi:hypothetical protein
LFVRGGQTDGDGALMPGRSARRITLSAIRARSSLDPAASIIVDCHRAPQVRPCRARSRSIERSAAAAQSSQTGIRIEAGVESLSMPIIMWCTRLDPPECELHQPDT